MDQRGSLRKSRKCFEVNKNENTTYQNSFEADEAGLREKYID